MSITRHTIGIICFTMAPFTLIIAAVLANA